MPLPLRNPYPQRVPVSAVFAGSKHINYKPQALEEDFDQMFDGQSFTLDEGQDLMLACCDCGSTHYIKIKILGNVKEKRKIKFIMTKDEVETVNQRKNIEIKY